jgi:hypothetical protein
LRCVRAELYAFRSLRALTSTTSPAVSVPLARTNGEILPVGSEDPCGHVHYSKRSPWLRAAVLGASDGLVTVGALMAGIASASESQHQQVLSAVAAMVSGVWDIVHGVCHTTRKCDHVPATEHGTCATQNVVFQQCVTTGLNHC